MKSSPANPISFHVTGILLLVAAVGLSGCKPDEERTPPGSKTAGESSKTGQLPAVSPKPEKPNDGPGAPKAAQMQLTSPAFAHDESIPPKYTADGADVSPPLVWSNVPSEAKELALICDDPDAPDPQRPREDPWVHWVIYKIPADTTALPEAVPRAERLSEPAGAVQGRNDWNPPNNIGYRGPSPPVGRHRYFFKLYALSEELAVEPGLDKESLLSAMQGKILAVAQLVGTYAAR